MKYGKAKSQAVQADAYPSTLKNGTIKPTMSAFDAFFKKRGIVQHTWFRKSKQSRVNV